MADQLSATHAPPPTNAPVGTRHPPIDHSPLRQSNPWDAYRRSVALKQVDVDCLVLEPKRWAAFQHLPLLLAAAAGPVAGLVYLLLEEVQGNAALIGALVPAAGLLTMSALLLSGVLGPRVPPLGPL